MPRAGGRDPRLWRLYAITDERIAGRSHAEAARLAIAGGAGAIQLRDKTAGGRALLDAARALREITAESGIAFIVNDRVDVALAADADGVHLGAEDLPVRAARDLLGPDRIIGASARSRPEAERAATEGADYLGVGPIREARGTKPDAPPPVGVAAIRETIGAGLPVIAIGGIRPEDVAEIAGAGACGVAVISAVMGAPDIAAAARAFREAWDAVRSPQPGEGR
ncbi:MAG: thiamine phosphate synthase [Planctomycetes bacterium]|nr:thiamine phosphate synthase [Planctomycetota bacterium]